MRAASYPTSSAIGLPPLIIGEREVDRFVDAFTAVMDDAHSGGGLMWDFSKTLVKQAVANR